MLLTFSALLILYFLYSGLYIKVAYILEKILDNATLRLATYLNDSAAWRLVPLHVNVNPAGQDVRRRPFSISVDASLPSPSLPRRDQKRLL